MRLSEAGERLLLQALFLFFVRAAKALCEGRQRNRKTKDFFVTQMGGRATAGFSVCLRVCGSGGGGGMLWSRTKGVDLTWARNAK